MKDLTRRLVSVFDEDETLRDRPVSFKMVVIVLLAMCSSLVLLNSLRVL